MTILQAARICVAMVFALVTVTVVNGQAGSHTVYGDISVDESKAAGLKPISLDIILYSESKVIVSRQSVPSNGRYRFNNLSAGFYDLVVEMEGQEVARVRIDLSSPRLNQE